MNFLLVAVAALLATPAQPAKTMTVDEIVAKSIEARGGAAKIAAIQSLRSTGKVVFAGGSIEAPFGLLMKRPGMIRSETTLQGLTAVQAYDGSEGWSVQPFHDPLKVLLTPRSTTVTVQTPPLASPLNVENGWFGFPLVPVGSPVNAAKRNRPFAARELADGVALSKTSFWRTTSCSASLPVVKNPPASSS